MMASFIVSIVTDAFEDIKRVKTTDAVRPAVLQPACHVGMISLLPLLIRSLSLADEEGKRRSARQVPATGGSALWPTETYVRS
jgi:hypothetical protein